MRKSLRMWVVGAVLLVVAELVLWPLRVGAGPILDTGIRFRIAAEADATADPSEFTRFSFTVPKAADITDVVLQNPRRDMGTLRVLLGEQVLLEVSLGDLTDRQYDIPLHVKAGQLVSLDVSCQIPGPPEPASGACTPGAAFFG